MKILIVSLIAILLIGCSALPLFDKAESVPVAAPQPEPAPVHEAEKQKPTPHPEAIKPVRKFHTPLEAKELTKPCRNIADENLYQEIRLKLTCVEETLK